MNDLDCCAYTLLPGLGLVLNTRPVVPAPKARPAQAEPKVAVALWVPVEQAGK